MKHQLIPVIHYIDIETTLRNTKIAFDSGCEYISLISMDGFDDAVLDHPVMEVKRKFPKLKIVVNRLRTKLKDSIIYNSTIGANTWHDTCYISSRGASNEAIEISNLLKLTKMSWSNDTVQFFGSVAFKYQQEFHDPNPALSAKIAYDLGFIPTTSGAATGVSAKIDKIKSMAEALPERCLAIASGITVENVKDYLPHVQYYFVSTGISKDFYNFDPNLVKELQDIISEN